MIALKNKPNHLDLISSAPVHGLHLIGPEPEIRELSSKPNRKSRPIGKLTLTKGQKAILWAVKGYVVLMACLFGYHALTLIK